MSAKNNAGEKNQRSVHHATFVIERQYLATPAQVFTAWSQPAAKARWFCGGEKWTQRTREMEFRVGGHERLVGAWAGGPVSTFVSCYQDIVSNQRIVYSYDMHLDENRISVSLATIEFKAEGTGTRLIVTEQGVFLDDFDNSAAREVGTKLLLDQLGLALQNSPDAG
jgi:uncharacterized protein YndB with AHSA1/START domain